VKLLSRVNVQRVGEVGEWKQKRIRAADAKEVGVGNPAEETYRYPNQIISNGIALPEFVNEENQLK
jgi:hypothetical protein